MDASTLSYGILRMIFSNSGRFPFLMANKTLSTSIRLRLLLMPTPLEAKEASNITMPSCSLNLVDLSMHRSVGAKPVSFITLLGSCITASMDLSL